jgi:superfamily I DNA/RNA helicase
MLHSKLKSFIEKKDGTFLVVGAPGTGKTHVLLELISYLLKEKNVSPDRILVFSFNRRWAKILREKSSEDSGQSLVEIPITSFFAYCAELIEKNLFLNNPCIGSSFPGLNIPAENDETQYSRLRILTAPDQWKLLKDTISGSLDKKNYPHTFRFMESGPHIYRSYLQEVFDFILRAQENLLTPQTLSNKFTPFYNQVLSEIVGIYVNYLKCLKDSGLYNYGRLLVDAAELLQNNKEFSGFCKKSYEFVIVDEFQEINRAQFEIVKNISNNNAIFFGNDDECTYAFRGSMLNNFNSAYDSLNKGVLPVPLITRGISAAAAQSISPQPRSLPGSQSSAIIQSTQDSQPSAIIQSTQDSQPSAITQSPPNLQPSAASVPLKISGTPAKPPSLSTGRSKNILLLEQNYRSNFLINKVCQEFIKVNEDRIDKKSQIHFSVDAKEGAFETSEFKTVMDEINFICSRIKKLIFLENVKPEKICVIVKGMGYKTRLLENILSGSSIPFMRRSSRTILENHFIKYILNFLKLIVLQATPRENSRQIEMQLLQAILCSEPVGLRPIFVKKIFSRVYPGSRLSFESKENAGSNITAGYKSAGVRTSCNPAGEGSLQENIVEFLKNTTGFLKRNNQKKSAKTGKMAKAYGSIYLKDLARLSDFTVALDKYIKLNSEGASAENLINALVNDTDIGILKHLLARRKNPGYVTINTLSLLGDYLKTINDFSESNPVSNTTEKYLIFIEDIINNNFLEEIEESTKEFLKPGFINILSYHQCKGLEFDAVFIPFINENYLPSPFGKSQLYDMQIFNYFTEGKSYTEEILKRKHLADERKLFYTGLSRAKDYIFVTSNSSEPKSRFFEELDGILAVIRKTIPDKSGNNVKKVNKNKTVGYIKANPDGRMHLDYKNRRLATLEKWLVRKRAISKIYKKIAGVESGRDTLAEDLIFLKEMYPPQSWWSTKKLSSNSNAPFRIISPVFSYSALSSYIECPVKYKINFYFKLKQDKNLSLLIGSIYHEIIKNFFENNKKELSWANLQKEITDVFALEKYSAFELSYLKKEIFEKAVEDFKNYYEGYVNGNALNVSSERAFSFDIGGSRMKGRIDQISFIGEEVAELIDFKSGKKNSSSFSEESEIQLRLYRMAVDLSPELTDLKGRNYSMKYIFLGDKKNQEANFDGNFYDFDSFSNFIKNTIREIKKERFGSGPKNSFTCKNCEYRIICSLKP